jgi:hypothetical protein
MVSSLRIEIDGSFELFVFVRWGMARIIASPFSMEIKALEALRLGGKPVFLGFRRIACKSSEILRATLTDRGRMYCFQDPSGVIGE